LSAQLRANSHIHLPPNFSAFDSVEQAVDLAAAEGIAVLGASNYYDYSVYREFRREATRRSIHPLFGIEIIALLTDLQQAGVKINDPGNPGKMYVCGKGITRFDPLTSEGQALLNVIRQKDSERVSAMVDRVESVFLSVGLGMGLHAEAVKREVVARHGCPLDSVYLQERHVCQSFQEALFDRIPEMDRPTALARLFGTPSKSAPADAVGIQNEIRSHLMKAGRPAYVDETFVDFDHAYRLILALGGIPCYPTLADGAGQICAFEADVERLISQITERNIHAAEFIPVRNQPDVLRRYALAMRTAGLVLTAGTEHNTRDLLPIEPTCVGGQPIPDDVRELFWEGACVVAAHQHLVSVGEPGYVDSSGNPTAPESRNESRISVLRGMGEALISRSRAIGGDSAK
jgi:hypothetical protein